MTSRQQKSRGTLKKHSVNLYRGFYLNQEPTLFKTGGNRWHRKMRSFKK